MTRASEPPETAFVSLAEVVLLHSSRHAPYSCHDRARAWRCRRLTPLAFSSL